MRIGPCSVRDDKTLAIIQQNRQKTPCGGDRRFAYVTYHELTESDKKKVRSVYTFHVKHLSPQEYLYPVTSKGRLAQAQRYISSERAKELYNLHQVRQVLES